MRICIFSDTFFPYISGVSSVVYNQAKALASRGNKILLFSPSKQKNWKIHENVKQQKLPFTFAAPKIKGSILEDLEITLPTIVKTARIIKDFNPEIIHSHTEFGAGWEALACSKILKIPIIGNFHTYFGDPEYLKSVNIPDKEVIRKMVWNYSISYLTQCNAVIVPSKNTTKELLKRGLKKKTYIISNGITLSKYKKNNKIFLEREKYGLNARDPKIIYVGRISEEKSLDKAIDAFRIVLIKNPNTKFIIVGDGPYMRKLEKIIKKHSLENKVILTGKIDYEKLITKNLYQLGDIFFSASKTENQPLSIMEAMVFGLPIVSVREKGMSELVEQGYNGFLSSGDDIIDMALNIISLISDKQLMKKMSKNSIIKIKNHDIEKIVINLEKIYTKTVSERKIKKRILIKNMRTRAAQKLKQIKKRILKKPIKSN